MSRTRTQTDPMNILIIDEEERWRDWRLSHLLEADNGCGIDIQLQQHVVNSCVDIDLLMQNEWTASIERGLVDLDDVALLVLHASNPRAEELCRIRVSQTPTILFSGGSETARTYWVRNFIGNNHNRRFCELYLVGVLLGEFLESWSRRAFDRQALPWEILDGKARAEIRDLAWLAVLVQGALRDCSADVKQLVEVGGAAVSKEMELTDAEKSVLRTYFAPDREYRASLRRYLLSEAHARVVDQILFRDRGDGPSALEIVGKALLDWGDGVATAERRRECAAVLRNRQILTGALSEYRNLEVMLAC